MRQFGYNVVFEHEATQADLFDHSGVKKLIDMALNGYACTAVAFGQTGSGKTHTMTGPPQQFQDGKLPDPEMFGIIQRSLKYMFEQLKKQPGQKIIRASYLEIYNEQVIDLLNTNQRRYLAVRWSKNRGFYVENLFVVECGTLDDIMAVLDEEQKKHEYVKFICKLVDVAWVYNQCNDCSACQEVSSEIQFGKICVKCCTG
ncbi:hypothetical protein ACJMK2_012568 [Sinanodonta woodiana]|uniref:Kinesin motor domain-containing protein n=1 Tax=Sinanodonta woodiana TaxID=1069815 RepID=A0ABD3VAK3_SINWO